MARLQTMQLVVKVAVVVLHFRGCLAHATTELRVSVGADATLSCAYDGVSAAPAEWSAATVEWNVVDPRAVKHLVYTLEDGSARVNRGGSAVDRTRLLRGDASLRLQNVTVRDEGLYTCRVITPVVHTETTSLQVLARPVVTLPETAAVTEGEEKTIQCDVTGFYPEKLSLSWRIQNGSRTVLAGGSRVYRVCTEMASRNPDDTYSIRSGITLHSSAVKSGEVRIICQVEHETYSDTYSRTVRLTVQAPPQPVFSAGTLVVVTGVISLLLVVSLLGGTFLLYSYFCKAPPSVSEISQSGTVYAQVPSGLSCSIRGARRLELDVKWFRFRDGGGGGGDPAEPDRSESGSLLLSEDVSEHASLLSDGKHHTSVLTVCLTVHEDLTRYRCQVRCRGKTFSQETRVRVTVEPSFLQISSLPQIPKVERLLVLCCRVENFYPAHLDMEWSRNDGEQVRTVTNFGPFSDHSRLYSMWSKIQLVMAREDESAVYTCRVYHRSFSAPGFRDVLYHINTQGTPPDVMFIDCEPPSPRLDEEFTLHLCIKDFCPEDVAVTWTKDGQAVGRGVFNTPPSMNVSGRYSMFSFLKLRASREDEGATFRCRVEHSAQRAGEERLFTLPSLRHHHRPDDEPHGGASPD